MDSGERREDRQYSPQAPDGRDAHEGTVVKVVPLVPDGVVERISEERLAPCMTASVGPILLRHDEDSVARLAADAVFLSQSATCYLSNMRGKPGRYRLVVMLQGLKGGQGNGHGGVYGNQQSTRGERV